MGINSREILTSRPWSNLHTSLTKFPRTKHEKMCAAGNHLWLNTRSSRQGNIHDGNSHSFVGSSSRARLRKFASRQFSQGFQRDVGPAAIGGETHQGGPVGGRDAASA
jgi:hypothetical protein